MPPPSPRHNHHLRPHLHHVAPIHIPYRRWRLNRTSGRSTMGHGRRRNFVVSDQHNQWKPTARGCWYLLRTTPTSTGPCCRPAQGTCPKLQTVSEVISVRYTTRYPHTLTYTHTQPTPTPHADPHPTNRCRTRPYRTPTKPFAISKRCSIH